MEEFVKKLCNCDNIIHKYEFHCISIKNICQLWFTGKIKITSMCNLALTAPRSLKKKDFCTFSKLTLKYVSLCISRW